MIFCTNCGQQNDDASRVCANCGTQLGSNPQSGQNPYQPTGPSSYPSGSAPYPPGAPQQPPPFNPYGAQPQPPPPPYGNQQPPPGYGDPYATNPYGGAPGYTNQPYGMQPGGYPGNYGGGGLMSIGEKRDPIMVLLFTLITCGIYGLWWFHTYATEIKNSLGRQDLNPTTDLILTFVTCGIWGVFAFYYKYPKLLVDMQQRVGLPPNDISMMTLLFAFIFGPVSIFLIQTELNKIWDAAGGAR
ncbi:MAG TPA: DUF4234 domain-containing protein [Pyrinomonadaceae bacterium]|jgi:hypothetical protein